MPCDLRGLKNGTGKGIWGLTETNRDLSEKNNKNTKNEEKGERNKNLHFC